MNANETKPNFTIKIVSSMHMETHDKKLDKNHFLMPDGSIYKLKNDRYKKGRGESRMLGLDCQGCKTPIMVYQKDGPGSLRRCYLDRIAWIQEGIASGENVNEQINKLQKNPIKCPHCQEMIGVPMIYEIENRPAVRMFHGQFTKHNFENPKD